MHGLIFKEYSMNSVTEIIKIFIKIMNKKYLLVLLFKQRNNVGIEYRINTFLR
jgi:hypothetical protein